mmetsp:Transcript_13699/g.41701  ORF Transcript_13699/g.41701 Transcript_13699/m.41701 type:complete len:307 (-) Transcript_13699:1240-2160(-)
MKGLGMKLAIANLRSLSPAPSTLHGSHSRRRGKTFKSQINLTAVSVLRPASAVEAPAGTFELQVRTLRSTLTYFLWPERNAAELFLALGNAVPSHATSDNLWATHMRSRPVAGPAEFRVGKTLGSGTFGKVKLAQRLSDGQMVAMKCLNRSRIVLAAQGERLAKEIRLLKLLNHPNVIRLHEVLHTPSEILMVMEYVPGGDLLEVLNTQPRFAEGQFMRNSFLLFADGSRYATSLGRSAAVSLSATRSVWRTATSSRRTFSSLGGWAIRPSATKSRWPTLGSRHLCRRASCFPPRAARLITSRPKS